MFETTQPLAVQISSVNSHPVTDGRSGVWGLTIFFVGIGLICCGLVPTIRSRRWLKCASTVCGQIVDNVPRRSLRGKLTWSPIVAFKADGTLVMSSIPSSETRHGWPLGDRVSVLYHASNPHQARLAGSPTTVSAWTILGIGVVGTFLAIVT